MIICAGNNETFPFATPIGVGLIESCINLTRLALFNKPDFLLFIGSAGSYGKYKPFDIIESSIASNIELSFLQNKSYTPLDNVLQSYHDDVSRETIEKHGIIINSSNYITTDFDLAQEYRKHKIELENMEFFTVLRVSQEFEIPVAGIFIVTNYCNSDAHNDFIKNHTKAKELLTTYVKNKYKEMT